MDAGTTSGDTRGCRCWWVHAGFGVSSDHGFAGVYGDIVVGTTSGGTRGCRGWWVLLSGRQSCWLSRCSSGMVVMLGEIDGADSHSLWFTSTLSSLPGLLSGALEGSGGRASGSGVDLFLRKSSTSEVLIESCVLGVLTWFGYG